MNDRSRNQIWSFSKRYWFPVTTALFVAVLSAMIYTNICCKNPEHIQLMNYYRKNALEELGVMNLVSSIYLGYRAYDTLGETFALVLAVVSGTFLSRGTKDERL